MAITSAEIRAIVEEGFAEGGELIKSANLVRTTGVYNQATLTTTEVETTTACRVLFAGSAERKRDNSGVLELPGAETVYVADLAAVPPKTSDRLRLADGQMYAIHNTSDEAAGTGYLFALTVRKV